MQFKLLKSVHYPRDTYQLRFVMKVQPLQWHFPRVNFNFNSGSLNQRLYSGGQKKKDTGGYIRNVESQIEDLLPGLHPGRILHLIFNGQLGYQVLRLDHTTGPGEGLSQQLLIGQCQIRSPPNRKLVCAMISTMSYSTPVSAYVAGCPDNSRLQQRLLRHQQRLQRQYLEHLVAAPQVPRTSCGRTASASNILWPHRKCLKKLVTAPQVP